MSKNKPEKAGKEKLVLRSPCHPEANGKIPDNGALSWTLSVALEDGRVLELHLGKKARDILFGMMIADYAERGESEPDESNQESSI